MKYYVYVLYDGDVPFYVGKGTGDRMFSHEWEIKNHKRKSSVRCKIQKMQNNGLPIRREKVFEDDDPFTCFAEEVRLIALYGRKDKGLGTLCNLTDGGEGTVGYSITDEHRARLTASLKLAYQEGRTGLEKAWEANKTSEVKEIHKLAMQKFYASDSGAVLKARKKEIGKSLLVDGKRVLSEEARQKMRDSAKRTNELKNLKRNIS